MLLSTLYDLYPGILFVAIIFLCIGFLFINFICEIVAEKISYKHPFNFKSKDDGKILKIDKVSEEKIRVIPVGPGQLPGYFLWYKIQNIPEKLLKEKNIFKIKEIGKEISFIPIKIN